MEDKPKVSKPKPKRSTISNKLIEASLSTIESVIGEDWKVDKVIKDRPVLTNDTGRKWLLSGNLESKKYQLSELK